MFFLVLIKALKLFRSFALFLAGALILLASGPVSAQLDSVLTERGWQEFTFDDKAQNSFSALPAEGGYTDIIEIISEKSVSIGYLPFREGQIDLTETPVLTFSWQRSGPAVDTDLTVKGGDDRLLAVYVAFPYQPERASFAERLTRPLVEAREGKQAPGRLLTYLWGGGAALGHWFENPYTGKAGYMQILQMPDAPADIWHGHQLDVAADFEARFGYPPPPPSYIAIAADSDDTQTRFTVRITTPVFEQALR